MEGGLCETGQETQHFSFTLKQSYNKQTKSIKIFPSMFLLKSFAVKTQIQKEGCTEERRKGE